MTSTVPLKPSSFPSFVHKRLEGLYPPFKDDVLTLMRLCHDKGLYIYPCDGFRSFASQDALFAKKPSVTNARGGDSYHNYGLAVDFAFDKDLNADGVQWSWSGDHAWDEVAAVAAGLGLKWGGNFKTLKGDLGHYEKSYGYSVSELKGVHIKWGLKEVWKKLKESEN